MKRSVGYPLCCCEGLGDVTWCFTPWWTQRVVSENTQSHLAVLAALVGVANFSEGVVERTVVRVVRQVSFPLNVALAGG